MAILPPHDDEALTEKIVVLNEKLERYVYRFLFRHKFSHNY